MRIVATPDLGAMGVPMRTSYGMSGTRELRRAAAMIEAVVPHLRDWLGRDVETSPTAVDGRAALASALH